MLAPARRKGGEYVHKRVFIHGRTKTEIKYMPYGQEEKKKQASAENVHVKTGSNFISRDAAETKDLG